MLVDYPLVLPSSAKIQVFMPSQLRLSSSLSSTVGHVEGLREQFKTESVPQEVSDLILTSWRERTMQYAIQHGENGEMVCIPGYQALFSKCC